MRCPPGDRRDGTLLDPLESLLGLLVQDPDTFLVHQVGQDARAVGVAVGRIIARLHKTRPTIDAYLEALEAPLPRFATAMRDCRQLIVLPPVR